MNSSDDECLLDSFDNDEVARKFVSKCCEVIHFKLVRSVKDIESDKSFEPDMCHQVFGKTEKIFGYDGLDIKIYYTAGWLKCFVRITYDEKIDPSVLPADNVLKTISEFLQHDYMENIDLFVSCINEEPKFRPSGVLLKTVNTEGENGSKKCYELFHVHVSNTAGSYFENYYNRLQRFLIWFIDGANYVDVDDERWNYFLMYEKYTNENNDTCYGIVGFCTMYEYYAYPDNIRPRISQLLVLPPFQRQGLAVHLLNTVNDFYADNDRVIDITVEDPTDNCQAIRDFVDMCRCEKLNCFSTENLKKGYSKALEEELRKKLKIHKKQARRLFEIHSLRLVDKENEEDYKKYRILVKNRLNAPYQKMNPTVRRMKRTFNPKEIEELGALGKPEVRLNTLKKMYDELEEQYEHAIERFENYKSML